MKLLTVENMTADIAIMTESIRRILFGCVLSIVFATMLAVIPIIFYKKPMILSLLVCYGFWEERVFWGYWTWEFIFIQRDIK